MRALLLVGILTLSACEAADAAPSSSAPSSGPVDGARARQLVAEGATLLDVRGPLEFASGHIPGAKNIPVDELVARAGELDRSKPIVTYCAAGVRSRVAAATLRDRGFTVYDLGSLSAWPR